MRGLWKIVLLAAAVAGAWHLGLLRRPDLHSMVRWGADLASGKTKSDLQHRAQHDLLQHRLKNAIGQYRSAIGENPTTLGDLIRQGVLEGSDRRDEWNRDLQMEVNHGQVLVRSAGPDGQWRTSDDWTLTL